MSTHASVPAAAPLITVTTDRPEAVYARGEYVGFVITVSTKPGGPSAVQWLISKDGVPPVTEGVVHAESGRATVTAKLDEPGFLRCTVTITDDTGTHSAVAGAAIDPLQIAPSMPAPDDFDAFWARQKQRLAGVPMNARLTPVSLPEGEAAMEIFDLQAECVGPPVSGYYARPLGAKIKGHPARLHVYGAGVLSADKTLATRWARRGVLSLTINAHGIPNGRPPEFYEELNNGRLKTYRGEGKESRDTFYFLGMFLRVLRALECLTAQPEWDGRTLIIEGGSQGGAQAMVGAALDHRVTFYTAMVCAMCDHTGAVAGRTRGWPMIVPVVEGKPDPAVLETSRYYDMVNFASRIRGRGYFWVGFIDPTCAPTTVYAAYNQVLAPKEMVHALTSAHRLDDKVLEPALEAVIQRHIDEQRGALTEEVAVAK